MIRRLLRKIRFFRKNNPESTAPMSAKARENLSKNLNKNLRKIKELLGNSSDVIIREFNIGLNNEVNAAVVCIDGMVEKAMINENIMKSLMLHARIAKPTPLTGKIDMLTAIKKNALTTVELKEVKTFEEVFDGILSGETVLLIDGYNIALKADTRGWETRGVQEPKTEAVVRGPREGFSETLRVNTALLRRKIKSPDLIVEAMKIGRVTRTDVCIAYIRGIANDKIVEELRKRLGRIDIDGILESGYIEEFIEDNPFSIFPTIGNTEKPDVAAAKLLEGRIAVITDGTPIVLTLPHLFVEVLQASEDYYSRPWYSTLIRWIRGAALITTIVIPSLYIAAQSYHHEMIPTELLITMAASKEGIPFPVLVETLFMGIVFEMLREAGVRMPRPIGQAVSIVGALVLGEAAVNAGIVSAPAVIVIGISGISGFIVTAQSDSIAIMRFSFMILAGFAGLFGLLLGAVFLMIHLAGLRSFGVPYLSPIAPTIIPDLKDVIIRAPLWAMRKRPRSIRSKNSVRSGLNGMPQPSEDEKKN